MKTWSEQLKAEGYKIGFAEGLAEARAEGMIATLVSMARQRFGEAETSDLTALLGSVTSEAALKEIGAFLLTCESSEDLIAKIRQS